MASFNSISIVPLRYIRGEIPESFTIFVFFEIIEMEGRTPSRREKSGNGTRRIGHRQFRGRRRTDRDAMFRAGEGLGWPHDTGTSGCGPKARGGAAGRRAERF